MTMDNGFRDRGILDVIERIASRGASGRLQISAGMTDGALSFDRGQLVEARLGRLSGFQAINALASVPDARYDFNPDIAPPLQSSITANERVLLKDFFGIDSLDREQAVYADRAEFIPEYDDEATLIRTERAAPEPAPVYVTPEPVYETPAPAPLPVAPAATYAAEPQTYDVARQRVARSPFRPALVLVLLAVLMVTAAVALIYRSRSQDSTASVAEAVQTAPRAEITAPPAGTTAPPAGTTAPPADTTVPRATATEPTAVATAPAETNTARAAGVPDLSGNWKVVNTVEQTSYQAYKNMQIGFSVSINQAGKAFTGTGEKISENGRSLPSDGRTPIVVKGTIDGDRVEATFSEAGAMRKTNGRFVWRIDKDNGRLKGTFVSSAARTRGRSSATKS